MKKLLRWCLRTLYGFRAYNEDPLTSRGPILLLPNHVSWWDWLFIGVCLENDWKFVTSSTTAGLSWLHRRIMINRRTFPVDMNSPYAVRHMAEYLRRGGRLVLFPEGRISTTGSLMKLFDGTGFLIWKTGAKVVTAYLRGADRLPLSRNPNRKQWFPRVTVNFSDILSPPVCQNCSVTQARARLTDWLRDQMVKQRFETEMALGPSTLPDAILRTARLWPGAVAVQDVSLQELSYRRVFMAADALAAVLRQRLDPAAGRVGILLPNANGFPVVLLSLWSLNKVPAILNYTAGPSIVAACARLAGLRQVLTSKVFVQRARLELAPLTAEGVQLVFLEDLRQQVTTANRLKALLKQVARVRPGGDHQPTDTAVVLFTSGSEGDPKGVELSHLNLLANIRQMLSVIDLMDTDRFFNALPLFHCFGLVIGLFLPLVAGSYVLLYVSPLHYRVIPSAFYNLNCTVLFGTNTLLAAYARKAHPYDFRTLRYAFAGAEKLQESTTTEWFRKFGVRVLEGYGATECSPVLSVNIPMHPRYGSTGQFLPGVEFKLEPVEGIEPGPAAGSNQRVGRLYVRGPNIMRGYLNPEANSRFQAMAGWYDTGDIVRVDEEGMVHMLGRLKRFAKISGEMVSLTAVEDALSGAFPQYGLKFAIAVIARPDEAKGEKLVAFTTEPRLTLQDIREAVRARGLSNLCVPRELKFLPDLPRLGSGKLNHRELERMPA
jgi:acyl-[acyl-carrier-protein]-phospholipid O-acyltransferase / long-chain-fatty-acid--[acyl-carrier-protein] ligase